MSNPSAEVVFTLADALGVDPRWLYCGKGVGPMLPARVSGDLDPFPGRRVAVTALRLQKVDPRITALLEQMDPPDGKDPGEDWWLEEGVARARRLLGAAALQAPLVPEARRIPAKPNPQPPKGPPLTPDVPLGPSTAVGPVMVDGKLPELPDEDAVTMHEPAKGEPEPPVPRPKRGGGKPKGKRKPKA